MACQDNVAGVVGGDGVGVSGCVNRKLFHLFHLLLCSDQLLGGNSLECHDHFWFNCPCVV